VAEGAGIVWSEEEEAQERLIALYNSLKGGCGKVEVSLFSQIAFLFITVCYVNTIFFSF